MTIDDDLYLEALILRIRGETIKFASMQKNYMQKGTTTNAWKWEFKNLTQPYITKESKGTVSAFTYAMAEGRGAPMKVPI